METTERAVFEKITSACRQGGYAIIDGCEFAEAFPAGQADEGAIAEALAALQRGGYIDVKYARGGTYCVAALKDRPEAAEDPARHSTVVHVNGKPSAAAAAVYALAAFLGAAAGSAAVCAIFAAV